MTTIFPSLRYRDARAAIDWLERAFGFERHAVHEEGGAVAHAELRLGDSIIMLGQERDEGRWGAHAGQSWLYVATDEVDALFARARDAGAEVVMELTDLDYGSRDFSVRDPEGNLWSFGTYAPSPAPSVEASSQA
jgi:uncharacterized glyoxalase superfamily protein PhnB